MAAAEALLQAADVAAVVAAPVRQSSQDRPATRSGG
jgi:hypothetical protein